MIYVPRTLSYIDRDGELRRVDDTALVDLPTPFVILGEPGMGKTRLLETYAAHLGTAVLSAQALLRRRPDEIRAMADPILVIDGLDELASATSERPTHQVLARLAEAGRPRFVMSCRSADWQGAIAKRDIAEDYGLSVLELMIDPLSRDRVREVLDARLGEAGARDALRTLSGNGMAELAGNPLFLKLIADLAAGGEKLPDTRAGLYAGACDLLRAEQNDAYQDAPHAHLAPNAALDAAGALFAALILTGKEAVSLAVSGKVSPDDLALAEVADLPGGASARAILRSGLFRRPAGEGDRVAPVHRTIAEYLGARWLAGQASEHSLRRVLGLMTYAGGVPASLRGLHAWLAHFSAPLSKAVIDTDPYGLILYGDADHLSVDQGRHLLWALKRLDTVNPNFRAEDWSLQRARGLTHPELADDLREVLFDPTTGNQLRDLLLEVLKGAPVVGALVDGLSELMLSDGPTSPTYDERRGAAEALIGLGAPGQDWPATVAALSHRAAAASHRLGVDIIVAAGVDRFPTDVIVDAALSYMGLLPGVATSPDVESISPLHYLARQIPIERIAEVLDAFAPYATPEERLPWDVQYVYSDLLNTLIARRLAADPPPPLQLLAWLRMTGGRDRHNSDARRTIHEYLKTQQAVRRAIQEYALLVEAGPDDPWSRAWDLHDVDAALVSDPEDVVVLLRSPHLGSLDAPNARKAWRDLVLLGAQAGRLSSLVSDVAAPMAQGDAELEAFLAERRNPPMPEWEVRQRAKAEADATAQAALWAQHRGEYEAALDEVRAGALGRILPLANAYLARYIDMDTAAAPHQRIVDWVGADVLAAAVTGFEAVLWRDDLPGSTAIAESYANGRRWNWMTPIMVGLTERAVAERGFDDLPRDVVLSGLVGLDWETLDEKVGGAALREAFDAGLAARPGTFEAYARLMIEPQLAKVRDTHHVTGLYRLVRQEGGEAIMAHLAEDWLRRHPDMPDQAELELLDLLIRQQAWTALTELAAARRARGYASAEHRLTWRTIDFLTDFERHRDELTADAAAETALFWHIRNRGGASRGAATSPSARLDRAAWFFRTFRSAFPNAGRPTGSSSGDENAWDAAEALRGTLNAIASDTSPAATALLAALRDEADDGYRRHILYVLAGQARAIREAEFQPPRLDDLKAVLRDGPPQTPHDLQAIALDVLAAFQAELRGDDVDTVRAFWDHATPWDENRCRDVLTSLLRPRLPADIAWTPERAMPKRRRADLSLERGAIQLPIEAKGQWNSALWTAATAQLDTFYTTEYRAQGVGVYLVFWFGLDVPAGRRLRKPLTGDAPMTPAALQAALAAMIPDARRGDLAVVVLDLSL